MTEEERRELWVDDLYEMTKEELQAEADRYARLARKFPDNPEAPYRFAFYRHQEAMKMLEALE